MPLNSETYDRRDYLEDEFGDVVDRTDDYDLFGHMIASEDEAIWAWYRDPETELTQVEARDRAQSHDYGERYNLTQSSVSRKIKTLDEKMLTEPIECLNTDSPLFEYGPYRELEKSHPEYMAAVRAWLAKAICDWDALRRLEPPTFDADPTEGPPAWAMDRLDFAPDGLISGWENGRFSG